MPISIITPHYNDKNGLLQIYKYLQAQTESNWEWIIVDDCSELNLIQKVQAWHKTIEDDRVELILNSEKSNASVCRNIGAERSHFENLIFLDADDRISENFVANRLIEFNDFAVFKNFGIINQNGAIQFSSDHGQNYLDCFLNARFIWQTSTILWKKSYFNSIGRFNLNLPRLQDVELAIRALQNSSSYTVLDNQVDFYYSVKPIRERKNFVKPVCEAVNLFISELLDTSKLNNTQKKSLSSYYYLCTKYLERSESFVDAPYVRQNLKLFYQKKYIGFMEYMMGDVALKLFIKNLLSGHNFLRVNRYLFKH